MENKISQAVAFLSQLNELDEEEYTQLLQEKIGTELIGLFAEYCDELALDEEEEENDEALADLLVHLMITGYLIRENEENQPPTETIVMSS